jgi:hypothetical protein
MVQVSVGQLDRIEPAILDLVPQAVLGFLPPAALRHAAIDEHARGPRHDLVSRSGDVARSAKETNLHLHPLNT